MLMKKSIVMEVQAAGMFSIQIDTTQDISVQDQCSIIIRYVNMIGVHEKLFAVVTMKDSKGKSFHTMLENILTKNGLNIENCIGNATDGAANMQGQYNGFSAWLSKSSPNQVHVWCYSHILNLVSIDATSITLPAASLFVLLNDIAVYFKESYKRMDIWKSIIGENDKRRLATIGNTRWWSKEKTLDRIFGDNGTLYIALIIALNTIELSESFNSDIKVKARNFKESLLQYKTILTAFIFINIFKILGPLSRYLQTKGMNLIKAQELVNCALTQLKQFQRHFGDVKLEADNFINYINEQFDKKHDMDVFIEKDFPKIRCRLRKKLFDENNKDEPILCLEKKYSVEVYNVILDQTISSIEKKFSTNKLLYEDLNFLSPNNFEGLQKQNIPLKALKKLYEVLCKFDSDISYDQLRAEYHSFIKNWNGLKKSLPESFEMQLHESESENEIEIEENNEKNNTVKLECKSCKNCVVPMLL